MRVAVIGHKSIARKDADVIAFEMLKLLQDPGVDEIVFAGIDGVAANALCFAIMGKEERGATSPKLTVVFPGKYGERPPWPKCNPSPEDWAQRSNQIFECGYPMGGKHLANSRSAIDISWDTSMTQCNIWVVNYVATCGYALVFWNGYHYASDVVRPIKYMQEQVIPWEHVEIIGEEDET